MNQREKFVESLNAYLLNNRNKIASRLLLPYMCELRGVMLAEEAKKAVSTNVEKICNAMGINRDNREYVLIIEKKVEELAKTAVRMRMPLYSFCEN